MVAPMSVAERTPVEPVMAGIGWMVLTTLCFVCVTGIVRYIGTGVPAAEAAFIRYAIGVALFLPLFPSLIRRPPSMQSMKIYALRGVLHGCAVILWFYAMARIPIAEVTALGYAAPIYVTIGAALFFGERLHVRRVAAVMVGFAGNTGHSEARLPGAFIRPTGADLCGSLVCRILPSGQASDR